ncbi:MAG: hypothetical protein KBD01_14030 [Acidobacteria bacterium]|nr:hypothetical protein [Acidobacteriota bacterium]
MAVHPSFGVLDRAISAHRRGHDQEALALAEAAWKMVANIPGAPPQAGVIGGFYGYLLGTVGSRMTEGLQLCGQACDAAFWEPRVFEYFARLQLASGRRREALLTLERGLAVSPDDRDLRALRRAMGTRQAPALSFLDRRHPLNRVIGRLLHRMRAPNGVPATP